MRRVRLSFVPRRMGSSWALLASLTVAGFVAVALSAALASFDQQALPDAVSAELDSSAAAMYIAVSGQLYASQAATADRVVPPIVRTAFGPVKDQLTAATWSNPLGLRTGASASPAVSRGSSGAAAPTRLLEAAAIGQVREHIKLSEGTWPGEPRPGHPIPTALPAEVAATLGLRPGDQITLTDRITGHHVRLQVTGTYQLRDPSASYWHVNLLPSSGVAVQGSFISYGPAIVSSSAFTSDLAVGGVSWVAVPTARRYTPAIAAALETRMSAAIGDVPRLSGLGLQANSDMPMILSGTERSAAVATSLLVIGALELLLVVGAAAALVGRLLARDRESECALLAARGAGRWQLVVLAAVEAVLLGAVAVALGVPVAGELARWLIRDSGAQVAGLHAGGLTVAAWLAGAVVFALCTAAILWPTVRPSAPGAARVSRGRQPTVSAVAAAGADVALVVLALLSVRELRAYSAVAHYQGSTGVDPALVVAPVLALAGLSLLPLRLLPLLARLMERLTARGKRLPTALASWEISRRPLRQVGPALLVVLAVGTATLALGQYQSALRSDHDQATYAVGADVRVDLASSLPLAGTRSVVGLPDVKAAMPVFRQAFGQGASELLAIGSRAAAATVQLRPDLAPMPADRLWRLLNTAEDGLALPGRPAWLQIAARVHAGHGEPLSQMSVIATIQDGSGLVYQVPAGSMPSDGASHDVIVKLARPGQASYPLRLLGVSFSYGLPAYPASPAARAAADRTASLAIGELSVPAAGGHVVPFANGQALAGWSTGGSSPSLVSLSLTDVGYQGMYDIQPSVTSWTHVPGGQLLEFNPSHQPLATPFFPIQPGSLSGDLNISAAPAVFYIPGIATSSFLRSNDLRVGSRVPVQVNGVTVWVRVVAQATGFPTATSGGAVVIDQSALQDALAHQNAPPAPVNEWWLATTGGKVPGSLPPHAAVASLAGESAQLLDNPLSKFPLQEALAIAVAVGLLAVLGFSVSVVASVRERRFQRAVLAALGVPKLAQARLLCLEELMLSVPASAAGLAVGVLLTHLLIPSITLAETGQFPFPPVAVILPVGQVATLAIAVSAVPVLAAALTVLRKPDPAAQLRSAEAA